jgi:hypothetical protein
VSNLSQGKTLGINQNLTLLSVKAPTETNSLTWCRLIFVALFSGARWAIASTLIEGSQVKKWCERRMSLDGAVKSSYCSFECSRFTGSPSHARHFQTVIPCKNHMTYAQGDRPCQRHTDKHTTWQVSRKNKGLGRAPRAPIPYFFVVNSRTLPSRDKQPYASDGTQSQS